MTEVITYETLREIQRKEKHSEKLVDLEDAFYSSVQNYLEQKAEDKMAYNELRNAKVIFEDIQSRREKKTFYQALRAVRSNEKPNLKEMTSVEKELFEKLVDLLKKYHIQVENGKSKKEENKDTKEEMPEKEENKQEETEKSKEENKGKQESSVDSSKEGEGKDYIKVKILEDVPQIVGADLKDYGPFNSGDVVELPPENAKIFVNNGKAEKQ